MPVKKWEWLSSALGQGQEREGRGGGFSADSQKWVDGKNRDGRGEASPVVPTCEQGIPPSLLLPRPQASCQSKATLPTQTRQIC